MKKIVSSLVVSVALMSTLNASDFYATVNGEEITKKDISMALQDPRIDFDKLPETAKKQVLEQIINRKLLSKKAVEDGIEKDSLLAKVSKAYMAILGDGKGGIFCEDSLELPNNWNNKTQQSIRLNSFDCLLANPPFGKDIKIKGKEKLAQYKLAKKWKKEGNVFVETNKANTEMQPQILFIERCLELLTDGGRMGIIIPETYFHAPRAQYVMDFMAKHNIFCLLDLPHNTFRPHNNAKCIAIFLEKNREFMTKGPYSVKLFTYTK